MKVEDCIVAVERRSAGNSFDLACIFLQRFRGPIFQLWLLNAIPSCCLVWLLSSVTTDMLIPSLLIFLFFSSTFSGQLIAGLGPQVFGEPFSAVQAVKTWRKRLLPWLFLTFTIRIGQILGAFCLLFPALMVTAWGGHLNEVFLLEQSSFRGASKRLSWLTQAGGYGRNMRSLSPLLYFWAGITTGVFIIIDLTAGTLLNQPLFLQQTAMGSSQLSLAIQQTLLDSPGTLTLLQFSLWLGWPLIRIAWFFCYLDQRIRSECWDLQVQFRAEAVRLQGARS